MRQTGDVIEPAPNSKKLGLKSPAFALFIVGFLEVPITVDIFLSTDTGGSSGPFWGAKFWRRGPNLPPFSRFSSDLGHFIWNCWLFTFIFYFMLNV